MTESGDARQQAIHLGIVTAEVDAARAWTLDRGATLAGCQPQPGMRVLLDPAGHPLCLATGPAD